MGLAVALAVLQESPAQLLGPVDQAGMPSWLENGLRNTHIHDFGMGPEQPRRQLLGLYAQERPGVGVLPGLELVGGVNESAARPRTAGRSCAPTQETK